MSDSAGVGADLDDFARHIAAQDVGKAAAVAGPQVEVKVVEGAGADAQQDFAGGDFRFGAVAVGEDIRPAGFVDIDGFHIRGSLRVCGSNGDSGGSGAGRQCNRATPADAIAASG